MQCCSFISRQIRSLNRQQFRCQSKSALFVSGKAGTKQFAVFKPKVDLSWVRENSSTLVAVLKHRNSSIKVSSLIEDLDAYIKVKDQVVDISASMDELQKDISERKKTKVDIQDVLTSFKSLKKQLSSLRDVMWTLEEEVVMEYLKLQNCDEKSILREKAFYSMSKGADISGNANVKRTHKELCELNNLAEFSSVSHSAYYLKNKLAQLDLELTRYFTNKLLMNDFDIISNPDFVKAVMVEGCGEDFLDPETSFNLRKYQDFGDRDSGNAMHLAGGASLAPAVAFFARQVVTSPGVLPVRVFCAGRHYRPLNPGSGGHTDLVTCHQSQAIQILSVAQSYEEMEAEQSRILDAVVSLLSVFPNFIVTEESLVNCERCNSRQFRIEMKGVEAVRIGTIGVQGKYFSERMMMVTGELSPLYTVSCHLNLTRVLAIMVELGQNTETGGVDLETVRNWIKI